ncbi:MAG: glycosyltransferase family 9 protein, partial [Hyphomonadaceae bacterium]
MARTSSFLRVLDRAIGAPLIALASVARAPKPLPAAPARILVLQPTAIGDAILSSGVVAHLGAHYPHARLLMLHGPSNGAGVALIDARFDVQTARFSNPAATLDAARAFKPDLVVDLTPWPRATALIARLAGGASVGFDAPGQARARAFDLPVPHAVTRHEIENAAAMA